MVQFIDPKGNNRDEYISEEQYNELLELLEDNGIEDGFVQELEDNVEWIPDFTKENPFPPHLLPFASFIGKRESN